MLNSRYFNNVTIIDDDTLKKSSTDIQKIIAEYKWYDQNKIFNCPKVSNLIVTNDEASYLIEYIHGHTLADLYINESLPLEVFNDIIVYILNKVNDSKLLNSISYLNYKPQILSMYKKKTLERLSKTDIDLFTYYTINGEKCPKLIDIINECNIDVYDSDVCAIHGDLCFSNIILKDTYDYRNKELNVGDYLYFIDPRGILYDKTISSAGDYRYDIGKLAHSIIGLYDQIKNNQIKAIKVSDTEYILDIHESDYKQYVKNKCFSLYYKDPVIYSIMIHLFLSMIPLHADQPEQQITMFANALRLYQERKTLLK